MCIVCLKEYEKFDKRRNGLKRKALRKSNCKTCSKRCSRILSSIINIINNRWYDRLKRNGIKLKDFKR